MIQKISYSIKNYFICLFKSFKDMSVSEKIQLVLIIIMLINSTNSYAAADTTKVDNVMKELIVPWIQKIGGVVAFIGAIIFAFGWKSDDAERKTTGLNTLISGLMAAGIATAYDQFF